MRFYFSIKAKPQPNRLKKPSAAAIATADSPAIKFVSELRFDEAPPSESQIKEIAPLPNVRRIPDKKLENLPQLFKPNGEDAAGIQFGLDSSSNPQPSNGYGLNLRQPSAKGGGVPDVKYETNTDMKLRKSREESGNESPTLDQFEDVPVKSFAATLLSGLGWKEGEGIGRNAKKEDVKLPEVTKKRGRGCLGSTEEKTKVWKKTKVRKEKEKDVMIVNGRRMGMKGKIMEARDGGDLLVVRMSKSYEKVGVKRSEVVEVRVKRSEVVEVRVKRSKVK